MQSYISSFSSFLTVWIINPVRSEYISSFNSMVLIFSSSSEAIFLPAAVPPRAFTALPGTVFVGASALAFRRVVSLACRVLLSFWAFFSSDCVVEKEVVSVLFSDWRRWFSDWRDCSWVWRRLESAARDFCAVSSRLREEIISSWSIVVLADRPSEVSESFLTFRPLVSALP